MKWLKNSKNGDEGSFDVLTTKIFLLYNDSNHWFGQEGAVCAE